MMSLRLSVLVSSKLFAAMIQSYTTVVTPSVRTIIWENKFTVTIERGVLGEGLKLSSFGVNFLLVFLPIVFLFLLFLFLYGIQFGIIVVSCQVVDDFFQLGN